VARESLVDLVCLVCPVARERMDQKEIRENQEFQVYLVVMVNVDLTADPEARENLVPKENLARVYPVQEETMAAQV